MLTVKTHQEIFSFSERKKLHLYILIASSSASLSLSLVLSASIFFSFFPFFENIFCLSVCVWVCMYDSFRFLQTKTKIIKKATKSNHSNGQHELTTMVETKRNKSKKERKKELNATRDFFICNFILVCWLLYFVVLYRSGASISLFFLLFIVSVFLIHFLLNDYKKKWREKIKIRIPLVHDMCK